MAKLRQLATMGPYRREYLARDAIAGLTVWAVMVPEALAYATIAGVSPVVGLYAVAPAAVAYFLLGSSRQLVVGPMSATAALSAAAVLPLASSSGVDAATLTAALAIVTGLVAIVAGLLRLGFIAGFISEPVLKGFIVGMALTIVIGQVPKLFGIEGGDGDFFEKTWHVITHLGQTNGATLVVGGVSLVAIAVMRRFVPKLPASLLVVLLAIAAVHLFALGDAGVATVGAITPGLAPPAVPHASLGEYVQLIGTAGGVALVGFAEGLGAAKEYASRSGYAIDPNRELLGLGAANFASGFFQGMVVNGSLSKTAVNGGAGAKSQLSSLCAAAMTVLTLIFLTPLFEQLPEATLAAVVILAVWELVDVKTLISYYHLWTRRLGAIYGKAARADFVAAIAALAGVLVFDTLPGLIIGVLVSLLLLVYRVSRPHIALLGRTAEPGATWADVVSSPDAVRPAEVVVARVDSALFFANADFVRSSLTALAGPGVRGLVLDAAAISQVDLTAARMLDSLNADLKRRGVRMVVASPLVEMREEVSVADGGATRFAEAATIDEAVTLASLSDPSA